MGIYFKISVYGVELCYMLMLSFRLKSFKSSLAQMIWDFQELTDGGELCSIKNAFSNVKEMSVVLFVGPYIENLDT